MKKIISVFMLIIFIAFFCNFTLIPINNALADDQSSSSSPPPQVTIPISPPIESNPPITQELPRPTPPTPIVPGQNPLTQQSSQPTQGQAVTPPPAISQEGLPPATTPPEQSQQEQPPTQEVQPPAQPVTQVPVPWYKSCWFIASLIVIIVIVVL
ncbi:MAG: hypothetical protein PHR42_03175, partial [Caldisericia bacterium]|nr:hypothetical protein [Caldisericia bacterium]